MKKLSVIIIALLLEVILVGGTVLAEEESSVELTKGEIEFKTTIFDSETEKGDNVDEKKKKLLSIDEGNRRLEAEFIGKVFNDMNWRLLIEEKNDNPYEDIASLAFTKKFNNSLVELAFWNGLDDITLKARKKLGKVEAQSIISIKDTYYYIDKEDIYIRYNFSDKLNITFKPYEADFTVGENKEENKNEFEEDNQFETRLVNKYFYDDDGDGIYDRKSIERNIPGIEVNYSLSEKIELSGSFWTDGYSKLNKNMIEGNDESIREIQLKSALDYEVEDFSLTVGTLIDTYSKTTRENKNVGEFKQTGIEDYNYNLQRFIPEKNFILNGFGEYEVVDDLSVEGEAKLGFGGYKNEESDTKKDLVDFGLYTKITKKFNIAEIYGSYKLERLGYENKDVEKLTRMVNMLALGAEKPIEEGLTLTGEVSLAPGSVTVDPANTDATTNEFFETMITTGLKYEF